MLEVLISTHNLILLGERLDRDAGTQDVEPVQRCLRGDLLSFALVGKRCVSVIASSKCFFIRWRLTAGPTANPI